MNNKIKITNMYNEITKKKVRQSVKKSVKRYLTEVLKSVNINVKMAKGMLKRVFEIRYQ